jgi:hypothetical protein
VFIDSYILEWLRCRWHCCEWVHPGLFPKVDCFIFPLSHMAWDTSAFPCCWLGLALPYLAFPDLAVHPNSEILSTCKSVRYTSQARIIQMHNRHTQHYTFLYQIRFFYMSLSGRLTPDNLFGHKYIETHQTFVYHSRIPCPSPQFWLFQSGVPVPLSLS